MKFLVITLSLLAVCWPAYSDDQVVAGTNYTLVSTLLQEERKYSVSLPDSYSDGYKSNYPVLYLLDGNTHFRSVAGVINHMSAGANGNYQIPELIVVAIHNNGNRMRDLTPYSSMLGYDGKSNERFAASGGGDKFMGFIAEELIPHIDATYRTKPHRTLVGHSLGGLMVLHTLLTQPNLFQNYIAIDSSLWWDNGSMFDLLETFISETPDVYARVYMTMADHQPDENGVPARMLSTNQTFAQRIIDSKLTNLDLEKRKFSNEDHGSVPLVSLYYGLLHLFENYKMPIATLVEGADAVTAHFKAFSDIAGHEFLPPESLVATAVQYLSDRMQPGVVQGMLELNATNYPNSIRAKEALEEYIEQ